MGRGPKGGREKLATGHQDPSWTRKQPSGPQLRSRDEGPLTPLPGPRAETSPVLRTLQRGRGGWREGPRSCILEARPTDVHDKRWPGCFCFCEESAEVAKGRGPVACLFPRSFLLRSQESVCREELPARCPPASFPPLPAPPHPRLGVAICFCKMWSFSKDIEFPLLLFSCHSQLKSINAPE